VSCRTDAACIRALYVHIKRVAVVSHSIISPQKHTAAVGVEAALQLQRQRSRWEPRNVPP